MPKRARKRNTRAVVSKERRTFAGIIYRSGAEADLARDLAKRGRAADYEQETLWYTVVRFSKCDWRITAASGKIILIESKGYFPPVDRAKVADIIKSNPDVDYRLLFFSGDKKHLAMCEKWAKRHKIKYAIGTIPDAWYEE